VWCVVCGVMDGGVMELLANRGFSIFDRRRSKAVVGVHVMRQDDAKSPGSDGASPYQRRFTRASIV